MGTAMKHLVPDRVKPSFEFLTYGHSDDQGSKIISFNNSTGRNRPNRHMCYGNCRLTHRLTFSQQLRYFSSIVLKSFFYKFVKM